MAKKSIPAIIVPQEIIFRKIYEVRGDKVMLDNDLAELYGVETKVLKQAVKRNIHRFPDDFMFELTAKEKHFLKTHIEDNQTDVNLRSQIVTSRWGGARYKPFAFTEQGIAMLSSVLNSPRAIEVNIHIMRIFVKMRRMVESYSELMKKIEKLEKSDLKQDEQIEKIYHLITHLLQPQLTERKKIGYKNEAK